MVSGSEWSPSWGLAFPSRPGRLTLVAAILVPAILFAFDRQAAQLAATFDFATRALPDSAFLSKQYEFLLNCRYLKNIFDNLPCKSLMARSIKFYDFQLFELVVWASLLFGLLRVIFELFNLKNFDRYSEKLSRGGGGVEGFLIAFVLLGPLSMYIAADFEFATSSAGGRGLILWSPRAFLCLSASLFGFATAISAEGLLFLAWVIFRRRQLSVEIKS
jgi:hypothetical protein